MLDVFFLMAATIAKPPSALPLSSPQFIPSTKELLMTQNTVTIPFTVKVRFLEAYQTLVLPPGASKGYPVGHAVVRLRIENLTEKSINFDIKKIEVVDTKKSNNRKAPQRRVVLSESVKPLPLGGKQIVEQGFHLTNNQGFGGAKKLNAIVTYQFDGKVYQAVSPLINVP